MVKCNNTHIYFPSGIQLNRRIIIAVMLFTAVLIEPGTAFSKVDVSLKLDRTSVQVGDIFGMTVSVNGARSSPTPKVAGLEAFHAVGTGSSSRFVFTNGQSQSGVDHNFQLTAKKEGVFTVGPASVTIKGKTYSSLPVKVKVSAVPVVSGAEQGPMFLTSKMTPETIYPGQEAAYTMSLYWSNDLASYYPPNVPEVPGLSFQEAGKPRQYQTTRNGRQYGVVELTYIVAAKDFQTYQIPPALLRVQIAERQRNSRMPRGFNDDFFFGRTATRDAMISSNETVLNVKPFPEAGRPDNFTGLVGWYSAKAELEPKIVKAGESATVTLTVLGRCNVRHIPDLEFPKLPGVKVYSDQPGFTEQRTPQGLAGKKVMKWALVPQTEETITIPPFSISFFDTEKGKYATSSTPPLTLEVQPGEAPQALQPLPLTDAAPVPLKQKVKLLGEDILSIHETPQAADPGSGGDINSGAALLILLLPFTPFLGSILLRRMRKKTPGQIKARASKKALGEFTRAVNNLTPEQAPDIQKALQEYLSARLNPDAAAMTSSEAKETLSALQLEDGLLNEFIKLFSDLEISVFSSGGAAFGEDKIQQLIDVLKKIDKKVRP